MLRSSTLALLSTESHYCKIFLWGTRVHLRSIGWFVCAISELQNTQATVMGFKSDLVLRYVEYNSMYYGMRICLIEAPANFRFTLQQLLFVHLILGSVAMPHAAFAWGGSDYRGQLKRDCISLSTRT